MAGHRLMLERLYFFSSFLHLQKGWRFYFYYGFPFHLFFHPLPHQGCSHMIFDCFFAAGSFLMCLLNSFGLIFAYLYLPPFFPILFFFEEGIIIDY